MQPVSFLFRLKGANDGLDGRYSKCQTVKHRNRHRFPGNSCPRSHHFTSSTQHSAPRSTKAESHSWATTTSLATQEWAQGSIRRHIDIIPSSGCSFWDRHCQDDSELQHKLTGTVLVSYPRSGNSLLRTTPRTNNRRRHGMDTRPDRALSKELAEMHNLVGEE
jgi:hypothetical protein